MATIYERKEKVAYITISRPEALNAMDQVTWDSFFAAVEDFGRDDDAWVLIVTGAGDKAFSAGADLKSIVPSLATGETTAPPTIWFKDLYKPIIAAVNGFCFAGAMEIVLATDIRVASENAVFGQTEAKWGIQPAGGAPTRLPRCISWCHAMEILLTADMFSAQEAYRMGLVNRVVPLNELMPTAERFARKICENGPLAVRAIKEAAMRSLNTPLDQALALEYFMGQKVFATKDAEEGPRAFSEKRKPVFRGN